MERRLSTIMAADLVGYSKLMASDEDGVISRLKDVRAAVDTVAEAGRGRAVVEDVAQVAAAAGTYYFRAEHAVGFVQFL